MELNEYIKRAHDNAVEKGFYDDKNATRELGTSLMLIVSELGEALEADRHNRFAKINDYEELLKDQFCDAYYTEKNLFEDYIKDSFEDEIADVFIRLFDFCGHKKIDIEKFIQLKMKYNESREKMHGKKY